MSFFATTLDRKSKFHIFSLMRQKVIFFPLGQYFVHRANKSIFCNYHLFFSLSPINTARRVARNLQLGDVWECVRAEPSTFEDFAGKA